MGEVVYLDYTNKSKTISGYVTENGGADIVGVYSGNMCAILKEGNVQSGTKVGLSLSNVTTTTKQEMNEFCIMWLSLFDPTAIKYDEE